MMESHNNIKNPNLSEILEADRKTKDETKRIIEEELAIKADF
jgi:hypothetical protein